MMEGTVIVLAEPRMFEDMGLGERVSVEEEEMMEGLLGLEGEVCGLKGRCGNSCHRRVRRDTSSIEILAYETVARLPLMGFLWV